MRNLICLLSCIFFFQIAAISQINNSPRFVVSTNVKVPATLEGKIFMADSLKLKKFTAGQILKVFLPQYTDEFQNDLISNLTAMYKSGFYSKELTEAVKTEYPGITLPLFTMIFYSAYFHYPAKSTLWPWALQDTINTAFNTANTSTVNLLKQAGKTGAELFAYFYYSLTGIVANEAAVAEKYRTHSLFSSYLKAGFTPSETLLSTFGWFRNSQHLDKWLSGYCKAMKQSAIKAEETAKALKQKANFSNERISALLKDAGYNATEILSAIQTL